MYCDQLMQRTHGEELVERQLAMEDVPARQAVGPLQILGRDDFAGFNQPRQIGRVLRQRLKNRRRPMLRAWHPSPQSRSL